MTRIAALFSFFAVLAAVVAPSAAFAQEDAVVASGEWTKKTFNIRGAWSIVERDGQTLVVLDDDFRTRSAPDLKIFLSPTAISDLENDNAVEGSLLIAELQSNRGGQTYVIPEGVDISAYRSIIIHCEAYTKLWGGAAL